MAEEGHRNFSRAHLQSIFDKAAESWLRVSRFKISRCIELDGNGRAKMSGSFSKDLGKKSKERVVISSLPFR